MLTTPAASAVSVIASLSAWFGASGFSQNTCFPTASSASVVATIRRRVDGGIELTPGDRRFQALEEIVDLADGGERRRTARHLVDASDDAAARNLGKLLNMMPGDAAGAEQKNSMHQL
jgi:hypothetical protein